MADVAPLIDLSDVSLVYSGANRANAPPEKPEGSFLKEG
jgi:hypothetical protein